MYLIESKQVGLLYHNTDYSGLRHILFHDILESNSSSREVSFTRDKNYTSVIGYDRTFNIQIVVDGNKLSNTYKIKPVADSNKYVSSKRFEAEETVIGPIKNFGRYILEIKSSRPENSKWYINVDKELDLLLLSYNRKYPNIKIPFLKDTKEYDTLMDLVGFYKNGKKIYSINKQNYFDIYKKYIDKEKYPDPMDDGYMQSIGISSLLDINLYGYDVIIPSGIERSLIARVKNKNQYSFLKNNATFVNYENSLELN